MGPVLDYNPLQETEYLVHPGLEVAEEDGALGMIASSYDRRATGWSCTSTRPDLASSLSPLSSSWSACPQRRPSRPHGLRRGRGRG